MELDFKMSFLANSQPSGDTNAASLKTSSNSEGKSFESTLRSKREEAKIDKRDDTKDAGRTRDVKKVNEKDEKDVNGEAKNAEPKEIKETNETKETDRTKETKQNTEPKETEAAKVQDNTQTTDESEESLDAAQAQMCMEFMPSASEEIHIEPLELTEEETALLMSQIAGVLGVTPEQITQTLEKLEIRPEELVQPENMNKLVMEVKGLGEPAELLTEPGISDTLKELRQIVNDAVLKAERSPEVQKTANKTGVFEITEGNTDLEIEAEVEVKLTQPAKADTKSESREADKTTEQGEINAVSTVLDEADVEEDSPKETVRGEAKVSSPANTQQFGGAGQQGGLNSGGNQSEQSFDENNVTPIVIHKGDETVVEVAGKTVSRTVMRPMGQDVINQIIDKMKIDFKPGQTEMKIRLNPVELGNVTVKLVSENGVVTAEIVTENSKTKELVEQNLEQLRVNMKENGVEVGGLSVSVGQQEGDERMTRFMREQTKSRARMSQIVSKFAEEDEEPLPANYANRAETYGYTVDYSA